MIPDLPPIPDFPVPLVPVVPFELPKGTMPSHPKLIIPPSSELKWKPPNPKVPEVAPAEEQPSSTKSRPTAPSQSPGQDLPETKEQDPSFEEVDEVTVPIIGLKIPVPRKEIVSTAAITSGVSVGAAMSATAILKRLQSVFKPLIKTVIKKINKLRNKPNYTWARKRLIDRRARYQGTSPKS